MTTHKDPFKNDCIDSISFRIWKGEWKKDEIYHTARVEFINGNTKGEQTFKAESFVDLVAMVEAFTNELK
jgi:hypothetical protein